MHLFFSLFVYGDHEVVQMKKNCIYLYILLQSLRTDNTTHI